MAKRKATAKTESKAQEETAADPRLVARGARMKRVRELAGYTSQLQASHVAGVDSGSVSVAERGLKDFYLTTAERLADAYRVSLDVLVGRAPMPDRIDRFPARDPIVQSPEFERLPKAVTDRFTATAPLGAERWSTMKWARILFDLAETFEKHGALPPPAESDESRRAKPGSR